MIKKLGEFYDTLIKENFCKICFKKLIISHCKSEFSWKMINFVKGKSDVNNNKLKTMFKVYWSISISIGLILRKFNFLIYMINYLWMHESKIAWESHQNYVQIAKFIVLKIIAILLMSILEKIYSENVWGGLP